MRRIFLAIAVVVFPISAFAQANGKLQIHYMNVGQGDGAVLISPQGEVVLFDDGVVNQCAAPIAYLQSLGITHIDYHIASHYHSDHIGCAPQIFQTFPLIKAAYDRGGSYATTVFAAYVNAVASKRVTAVQGQSITLDAGSANPVTITFVALNGNGITTTDENDLSLVAAVHFGTFDAEFGGDLGGSNTGVADTDPNVPVTPACSYSVVPRTIIVGSPAPAATTVSVTTTPGCSWTASSNASWIAITSGASGSGSGTIGVSIAANSGGFRNDTMTVAGLTVFVQQLGNPACAPATAACGAVTAHCGDGTVSCSQTYAGTCSSHGGIVCFVCPGVLCNGLTAASKPSFGPFTPIDMPASYADIETSVAGLVGRVEVYKVHHHGSATATNTTWMNTLTPKVAIVSAGASNPYGYPTSDALARLHSVGAKTYWTTSGNGAAPTLGSDFVANDAAIVVQAAPGSASFTVTYNGITDTYADWEAPQGAPFGSFDTPGTGTVVAGEVAVTGWALDDSGIAGVDIYRSPMPNEPTQPNGLVFIGSATQVCGARRDVANAYPSYPGKDCAGWGYMLLSNFLPTRGSGTFTIFAYARAVDGDVVSLGSKQIVGANTTARKPFGTIDTPGQGETVSGTIVNFGWALTPPPNSIPVDGSTITVFIDGLPVGHPDYGHARPDIQSLFPGYANTNTAVGAYIIDTTRLANGLHTIAWSVADNAGNANGIGSRDFSVSNGFGPPQAVGGLVPQGGILHVNPSDPTLVTLPVSADGNLTQLIGSKDANGLPTGVTELRRFIFNSPSAYDDVRLTPNRLPGDVLLRDGSRVNFAYGNGLVTASVTLPGGTGGSHSALFTPPSVPPAQTVAPLSALSNETSGPLISIRVHVFSPPSNAVNDATVTGDFDAGRDANGAPMVGPYSAIRTSDGIYEGTLAFTPVSKPLLDEIVESACELTEKGVEDICGAMEAVSKSWAEQAKEACEGLAAIPEVGEGLSKTCSAAVIASETVCKAGPFCKAVKFLVDRVLPAGPVTLHTHVEGSGYFATDARTITVPYPNPVAIEVPVACSSLAGSWGIHLTGTGDLTGQDADAAVDLSQSASRTISGTLILGNPTDDCAVDPWSVSGSVGANGSVTFTATSSACGIQGTFTGFLAASCNSASGTGSQTGGSNETFTWTMVRR